MEGFHLIDGVGGVQLPPEPLEDHRPAGEQGHTGGFLAGKGEGKLQGMGEELVFAPGVDGTGTAEGIRPQHPEDMTAAVTVLEDTASIDSQGHNGVAFVGAGLFIPDQPYRAELMEIRVLHGHIAQVMFLVHGYSPTMAAVIGAGWADAGKVSVIGGLYDFDFLGGHKEMILL